jgi:hypothetical protein
MVDNVLQVVALLVTWRADLLIAVDQTDHHNLVEVLIPL